MIDENLPIFYFQKVKEKGVHDTPILLSEYGNEATPAYTLRRPDPLSEEGKNRYAVALYDAWVPDLLYGEVLLEPDWTHPTLSAEAIRANGGVAPPPQPLLPNEFTIQLYNPDQQVKVRHVPAGFTSQASWEFEMPQETFKRPSNSSIDRAGSDPTALSSTPMINMRWKRTGRLTKDLMCYLTGKSQNIDGSRKKQKEPDIPLSFFHQFAELTVYEPNVMRLDMEDLKGFEVAIILCAATIRDAFFTTLREAFNVTEIDLRSGAAAAPRRSSAPTGPSSTNPGHGPAQPQKRVEPQVPDGFFTSGRPALDPRKQWELDNETVRIKQQLQEEERARQRREAEDMEHARKLQERERRAEEKRLRAEEKETERLRREWEAERAKLRGEKPNLPPRKEDKGKRRDSNHHNNYNHSHQSRNPNASPYLGVPDPDFSNPAEALGPEVRRPKSSLGGGLNIFGRSDDNNKKVLKKKSSYW